ncbi:hypothetical protein FACS189421_09410 [Bacteroidia bacterium]|nr:hypothetical protein FACS189421_09410 [Bacteroidia bacterium]
MQETTGAIQNAADSAGQAAAQGNDWMSTILLLVVMFGIIYFLMILPNKRKMKEYKAMLDTLKVGSKILCAGGIYGTVKKISGDKLDIEIAKGVVIEIAKQAVVNIEK